MSGNLCKTTTPGANESHFCRQVWSQCKQMNILAVKVAWASWCESQPVSNAHAWTPRQHHTHSQSPKEGRECSVFLAIDRGQYHPQCEAGIMTGHKGERKQNHRSSSALGTGGNRKKSLANTTCMSPNGTHGRTEQERRLLLTLQWWYKAIALSIDATIQMNTHRASAAAPRPKGAANEPTWWRKETHDWGKIKLRTRTVTASTSTSSTSTEASSRFHLPWTWSWRKAWRPGYSYTEKWPLTVVEMAPGAESSIVLLHFVMVSGHDIIALVQKRRETTLMGVRRSHGTQQPDQNSETHLFFFLSFFFFPFLVSLYYLLTLPFFFILCKFRILFLSFVFLSFRPFLFRSSLSLSLCPSLSSLSLYLSLHLSLSLSLSPSLSPSLSLSLSFFLSLSLSPSLSLSLLNTATGD